MDHRLKRKIIIDKVFAEGKTGFSYPVKMFYLKLPLEDRQDGIKYGVTVSKRNYKRAVDRNLLKRRMREAIRSRLKTMAFKQDYSIAFMCIYVGKEIMDYKQIEKSISRLLSNIR